MEVAERGATAYVYDGSYGEGIVPAVNAGTPSMGRKGATLRNCRADLTIRESLIAPVVVMFHFWDVRQEISSSIKNHYSRMFSQPSAQTRL